MVLENKKKLGEAFKIVRETIKSKNREEPQWQHMRACEGAGAASGKEQGCTAATLAETSDLHR